VVNHFNSVPEGQTCQRIVSTGAILPITGKIVGYDPAGNGSHGVASLHVFEGEAVSLEFSAVRNAHAALRWLTSNGNPIAAGIDALTVLSTGDSGWRPADRWLRDRYPQVRNSVVNPNYLNGSVGLNGFAVAISLRNTYPDIQISETHPKVLYYCLSGKPYSYDNQCEAMNMELGEWIGLHTATTTEHEWDAVISCLAVLQGLCERWTGDLHRLPVGARESLVWPCGISKYYWPESPLPQLVR
jgi:hypothetical protein